MTELQPGRVASNEALFRRINDEVEGLNARLAGVDDGTFHIVCECGELSCHERLRVPISAYEAVRADPKLFLVLPAHEIPTTEDVVETESAYVVVRKHSGVPEQVARATDPRQ